MTVAIFIPCHLNSIRFPNKILTKINNLEMIEHVRRRALLSKVKNVHVVTNSKKISKIILKNNGSVFISKKRHLDGSSRVNEIVIKLPYKKIILLQGDEPLILPSYLSKLSDYQIDLKRTVLNLASKCNKNEIYDLNIVKCLVDPKMYVIQLFRDPNDINKIRKHSIFKILGTMLYPKEILNEIYSNPPFLSKIEKKMSIEQIKVLKKKYKLKIVLVNKSTQSINTSNDKILVEKILKKSKLQQLLFSKIA